MDHSIIKSIYIFSAQKFKLVLYFSFFRVFNPVIHSQKTTEVIISFSMSDSQPSTWTHRNMKSGLNQLFFYCITTKM